MAKRPIFIPNENKNSFVAEKMLEFEWSPGMSKSQKQKSIRSLHAISEDLGISPVLEISSKSENPLGVQLSAFNLMITTRKLNKIFSVESAFQSSKIFDRGGPYSDLLSKSSLEAKRDIRLKESGNLIGFSFFGKNYPLKPRTIFYDWLYVNAINQNPELGDEIIYYKGFTDIEFNPKKSINCQAYSAALYCSLRRNNLLNQALSKFTDFSDLLQYEYLAKDKTIKTQHTLI